jgi:hypothetical protein
MATTTPTGSRTTFELPTCLLEGEVAEDARIHAEGGGRRTDLDALRELVGHAHFQGDGARDLVGARLEAFLDLLQQLGAACRRRCRPGVEGLACGGDCRIGIGRVALRDARQQRAVGRRMHLDAAAAGRGDHAPSM